MHIPSGCLHPWYRRDNEAAIHIICCCSPQKTMVIRILERQKSLYDSSTLTSQFTIIIIQRNKLSNTMVRELIIPIIKSLRINNIFPIIPNYCTPHLFFPYHCCRVTSCVKLPSLAKVGHDIVHKFFQSFEVI
jgi:hypothetical protein